MPENTTLGSENKALDNALADLERAGEGHGKSGKYTAMENSLKELAAAIDSLYKGEDGKAPVISEKMQEDLITKYNNAITACNNYVKGKGDSRKSGYGTARLQSVLYIIDLLKTDRDTIAEPAVVGKILPTVLEEARITEAELEVSIEDLNLAGDNSSTRIPLELDTEIGTVKGFFTEDYTVESDADTIKGLSNDYNEYRGNELVLAQGLKDGNAKSFIEEFDSIYERMNTFLSRDVTALDQCAEDGEQFENLFGGSIKKLFIKTEQDKALAEKKYNDAMAIINKDPESRKAFFDMVEDSAERSLDSYSNNELAGIPYGDNVPNRNVGVYKIAKLFGMEDLIAKAEIVELKDKDGNIRKGVFQHTAEGSDIKHLKADDPMTKLASKDGHLSHPETLKKIADLQLLDYICGSCDRHPANMIYDIKEVDGRYILVNLIGIDNDRSLGTLKGEELKKLKGHAIDVQDLKVISKDKWELIKDLTKDKLSIVLKELNYSDDVLQSCIDRIGEVKTAIKKGQVKVIDAKEYKDYMISKLSVFRDANDKPANAEGELPYHENLFNRIKEAVFEHKDLQNDFMDYDDQSYINEQRKEAKDIKYNKAKSKIKLPKYDDSMVIRLKDIESALSSFKEVQKNLDRVDSIFHKNSGNYKWMKEALDNAVSGLNDMKKNYAGKEFLEAEDARKVDSMLRQMSLSAKKYVETHHESTHTLGGTRYSGAKTLELMGNLRTPRAEAKVKKLSYKEAQESIIKVEKEKHVKRITRKSVEEARNKIKGNNKNDSKVNNDNAEDNFSRLSF